MPESPLVQKETVALTDLEALIADRAKGESETELGFRKRIEREETEYKAGVATARRQVQGRQRVAGGRICPGARRGESRRFSATPRHARTSTPRPRSRSTTSSRRTSAGPRRPRKRPAGKRWRSSRARATRESSGGGRPRPTGTPRSMTSTSKQETAEFVLKRCGKLAAPPPEKPAATPGRSRRPPPRRPPPAPMPTARARPTAAADRRRRAARRHDPLAQPPARSRPASRRS